MFGKQVYRVLFAGLALLTVSSAAHAQVQNLVLNPSFETDEVILDDPAWEQWATWGWDSGLTSTVEISETEFVDGARSLRIIPKGDTNWYFIVLYLPIPCEAGQTYTASFWVKAEQPRPLTARFKATDNSVDWGATDFQVTGEWAEYAMTSEAKSTSLKFEIFCSGSEVPFWLDFVNVYQGQYVAGIEPSGVASPEKAARPDPADGAVLEQTWATLSWRPGAFAASHNVYLGNNLDDVQKGAADTFRGNQATTSVFVGFPGYPYPDGLVPGTTYYWRVDEVNDANAASPWKGDVWSFSIAPRTAYNANPADGAESVALDTRLSWTAGFEAKLHTVYFGDNFDDVNNAISGGTMAGTTAFNPGPLKAAKVYYWRVDETNPPNTYKGQVWSFSTVGAVGSPCPTNGAPSAEMNAILTWKPGAGAASHQVYFGTDKEAVRKATGASPEYKGTKALGAESYDPGLLAWDSTFYWRVDEVNNANPDSPWKGPLWSFTTGSFLLVDGFESYNDIDPPNAGSNRIFDKWIDGFATTTNGAVVGNTLPPYTQRTNVHGGAQAMPLSYDNNRKFSEATLTLTTGKDWTREGVANLSLWFRGLAANTPEKMYVALNGTVVVYNNDTALTQKTGWTEWVIPLQQFTGVNLTNVTSITIGFGNRGNTTTAGGTGQMYFDDIRLYR